MLEFITTNFSGNIRRATLHGRPYIVAPMTLIVPGVLNGSRGKLRYRPEVVGANPSVWNGMPMVAYHPVGEDGKPTTARDPAILEEHGLGFVFRSQFKSNLDAEGWFDEELTAAYDKKLRDEFKILPRLTSGRGIESSTGLFTYTDPAEPGATYNGVAFDEDVAAFDPDHLAILPDKIGACSIKDGCGVNPPTSNASTLPRPGMTQEKCPNCGGTEYEDGKCKKCGQAWPKTDVVKQPPTPGSTSNTEGDAMKKQLVTFLCANCSCWKGKEKVLEGLDEAHLKEMKGQYIAAKVANAAKKGLKAKDLLTSNQDGEGDTTAPAGVNIAELGEFLGVTTDPATDPIGYTKEITAMLEEVLSKLKGDAPTEPAADTPADEPTAEPTPTGNKGDKTKRQGSRQTFKQMLQEHGTPQEKEVWNTAVETMQTQKKGLIARLTKHLTGNAKAQRQQRLAGKSVTELKELWADLQAMMPQGTNDGDDLYIGGRPSYAGAGGGRGPIGNARGGDSGLTVNNDGSIDTTDDDDLPVAPTMNFGRKVIRDAIGGYERSQGLADADSLDDME